MSEDGRSPRPPAAPSPGPVGMSVGPWIGRALAALAHACSRRPLVTVLVSVALAAAAMAYTLHTITFVTSSLRLLPQHERYVVLLKEYQRDFGELNDIVVVVEAPSPELSKAYAARLVQELGQAGVAPSRVTYRIDRAYFDRRGLLYLPVDELIKLRDRLFDYQEFIEGYAAHPDAAPAPRGPQPADRQRDGARILRSRAGQRDGDGPALPRVDDRSDLRPPRRQIRVYLPVGHRLLGGPPRRSRRRVLLLGRPALALPVREAAAGGRQLRGEPRDDRGPSRHHQAPPARVPRGPRGRDRGPGHLERRDGHRLRRQQGGHASWPFRSPCCSSSGRSGASSSRC